MHINDKLVKNNRRDSEDLDGIQRVYLPISDGFKTIFCVHLSPGCAELVCCILDWSFLEALIIWYSGSYCLSQRL
jgi:hypothetical protein